MAVRPAAAGDHDAVIDLIVAQQVQPERHIPYLGDSHDGIVAELDGLETAWTDHLHVAVGDDSSVIGAAFADVDEELGRAWIHGPWVAGDDDAWARWATPLVTAVERSLPSGMLDIELSGDTRNARLAALAASLGCEASEINWVYTLPVERAVAWPAGVDGPTVRPAVDVDATAMIPLHDLEFPDTYLPIERMLSESAAGERTTVVAVDDTGVPLGYASGEVQADGAGYIDFLAVDPTRRGRGAGRALVVDLVRRLLPDVTTGAVHLTVQDGRAPARALYERLGFTLELGLVGYRRR